MAAAGSDSQLLPLGKFYVTLLSKVCVSKLARGWGKYRCSYDCRLDNRKMGKSSNVDFLKSLNNTRAEILSTVRLILKERFDSPTTPTQNYKQCLLAARESFYVTCS